MTTSPARQRHRLPAQEPRRGRSSVRPRVEFLEDRSVPATFTVASLADSGAGSLRQAILDANGASGIDRITFSVAGTIQLTSGALPDVTDPLDLDGSTAPGFTTGPTVGVDYNGNAGLRLTFTALGSTVRSLGHTGASGAGITLDSPNTRVVGNYVGLALDGVTAAGNGGAGIVITGSSSGNLIGGSAALDQNVISGNAGDGVVVTGSAQNRIVANFIGTDATGTLDRGNGGNGVLLTNSASFNTVGGTVLSSGQFTGKAPEGNVISGNGANGVFLTLGSSSNTLAANFIGTDLTGTLAVGNTLDGVAVTNGANDNALLGTFNGLTPFIFYNVIGGNGGNGLRLSDVDGTLINANFFGLGADNNTPVGNTLNGVLVENATTNTIFGGVIPLGNVTAANLQNGVLVRDIASGFLAFNTFAGVGAFNDNPNVGNRQDGFLITSTGGDIVLRTNVISANGDDGVEISGDASGVRVVQNIIGLNTGGNLALGNGGNGVEFGGTAHGNVIGGPQGTFSVIPQNAISANGGHGVAVGGAARDNVINFSRIGTNLTGTAALGNAGAGVFLGAGTTGTAIGSADPVLLTVISGNRGAGIQMTGTTGNAVVGTLIGAGVDGTTALPNLGDGVLLTDSSGNRIGGTAAGQGNTLAFNGVSGVRVVSGTGNAIRQNSIAGNTQLGIDLAAGANDDQAAPTRLTFVASAAGIQVAGGLTGTPGATFTVEVFASESADPSGFGEGQFYLGLVTVTTDAAGVGRFTFNGPTPPAGALVITATATDSSGNTSEFSAPAALARVTTIGAFDPASATWYLRNSNSAGAPDAGAFQYGVPGWLAVVGDWDGDGIDTVAVVDPTTSTWYVRNSNTPGAPDYTPFQYGVPGWIPVAGDWDGSGQDGIGFFDPVTGTWYLRNEVSGGAPDAGLFAYGSPGWTPVVGDWDGDGVTTVGVVDPAGSTWYLRNSNAAGFPDAGQFLYGLPGWSPVAGDWDGDGVTTVGVVDPAGSTWYLRNSNGSGAPDAGQFSFGVGTWTPVTGVWGPPAVSSPSAAQVRSGTASAVGLDPLLAGVTGLLAASEEDRPDPFGVWGEPAAGPDTLTALDAAFAGLI